MKENSNISKKIFGILLFIILILVCMLIKKDNNNNEKNIVQNEYSNPVVTDKSNNSQETIHGYVNTFGGYTSLFAANGGNKTEKGSSIDKKDLNLEILIEDDDDEIIKAFKDGDIQFFAMTVNKLALVVDEFEKSGSEVVVPCFLDTSTGGDGIIVNEGINTVKDLRYAKIGLAKESVSTAIPVWLLNESGLSEDEIQTIVDNFVLYDSTQDAVEAFVNNEVDAVSTWDITTALDRENSHLLFSTANAEYLVIDALVFEKEFAKEHTAEIEGIIDALLSVVYEFDNDIEKEVKYQYIKESVEDYKKYSYRELEEELSYARFLGYNGNIEAFEIAEDIYIDFCKIWRQLGYSTNEKYASKIFDNSYLSSISNTWEGVEKVRENNVSAENVSNYNNEDVLISQYAKILFNDDTSEFKRGYEDTNKDLIDEFVKVAKVLNKTVIKISGHVNLGAGSSYWDEYAQSFKLTDGYTSSDFAYKLSKMRADTVKEYMMTKGIEEERMITEGYGGDQPIDSNDTEEGRSNNRSCEISFYQAGY